MTVQAGQTHYYVATAVDGTGAESVYSNEIQLVIPYP
jgi:fibronectin type 3 domain-containing protein